MEMSLPGENATASEAELVLTLTENGAAIASARLTLRNARCLYEGGAKAIKGGTWTSTEIPGMPVPIANGEIDFRGGEFTIAGEFTSQTEARATVDIVLEETLNSATTVLCDFGSWHWSGDVAWEGS